MYRRRRTCARRLARRRIRGRSAAPIGAHHFDDREQQHEAADARDVGVPRHRVMFFGGLFWPTPSTASRYPEAFAAASHDLDISSARQHRRAARSSLTMALAVHAGADWAQRQAAACASWS